MKENLILVNYKVESEAYQALSELKRETSNANYTISQAAIVKKERIAGRQYGYADRRRGGCQ